MLLPEPTENNQEVYEHIQQLPVNTVVEMKNCMFTTMLLVYLKKVANNRNKPLYTFKDEGLKICQALIQKDEADESLIKEFEEAFQLKIMKERDVHYKVIKKFTKALSKKPALIDSMPLNCVKNTLAQLAELQHVKETWRDETYRESALPGLNEYFYTYCLGIIQEYFEEPIASSFC